MNGVLGDSPKRGTPPPQSEPIPRVALFPQTSGRALTRLARLKGAIRDGDGHPRRRRARSTEAARRPDPLAPTPPACRSCRPATPTRFPDSSRPRLTGLSASRLAAEATSFAPPAHPVCSTSRSLRRHPRRHRRSRPLRCRHRPRWTYRPRALQHGRSPKTHRPRRTSTTTRNARRGPRSRRTEPATHRRARFHSSRRPLAPGPDPARAPHLHWCRPTCREPRPRLSHRRQRSSRPPEDVNAGEDMYDVPLGTLVYRSGLLGADQIESALAESERIGKRLGEVLIDNKMIDERDLGRLLAGQKGLPFLDLAQTAIEPAATELLPSGVGSNLLCPADRDAGWNTRRCSQRPGQTASLSKAFVEPLAASSCSAVATSQRSSAGPSRPTYGADENEAASDDVPEQSEQPSVAVEPVPEPPAMTPVDTPPAEPVSEFPAPKLTPPAASDLDVTAPAAQPPVPAPQPPTAADIAAQTAAARAARRGSQPDTDPGGASDPAEPFRRRNRTCSFDHSRHAARRSRSSGDADGRSRSRRPQLRPRQRPPWLTEDRRSRAPNLTQREAGATTPVEKTVRVMIRLSDGDQVDAGCICEQRRGAGTREGFDQLAAARRQPPSGRS